MEQGNREGFWDVSSVLFLNLVNLLSWYLLEHFVNICILYTLLFVSYISKMRVKKMKFYDILEPVDLKGRSCFQLKESPSFAWLPWGLGRSQYSSSVTFQTNLCHPLLCTVSRSRKFKIPFGFILMSYIYYIFLSPSLWFV